jgi:hypothetical protein
MATPPIERKEKQTLTVDANRAEQASGANEESGDLPAYTEAEASSSAAPAYTPSSAPPLVDPHGDMAEELEIPFFTSVEKLSAKRFLTGRKTIEQKVYVRKMRRDKYLANYAHDADG